MYHISIFVIGQTIHNLLDIYKFQGNLLASNEINYVLYRLNEKQMIN